MGWGVVTSERGYNFIRLFSLKMNQVIRTSKAMYDTYKRADVSEISHTERCDTMRLFHSPTRTSWSTLPHSSKLKRICWYTSSNNGGYSETETGIGLGSWSFNCLFWWNITSMMRFISNIRAWTQFYDMYILSIRAWITNDFEIIIVLTFIFNLYYTHWKQQTEWLQSLYQVHIQFNWGHLKNDF